MNVEIAIDGRRMAGQSISMDIEIASRQLESLGSTTRLQIYRTLVRAGQTGLSVGTLQDRMGMAASTLSHHIKRLVDTGLVSQERVATTLICRAEYPAMRGLIGFLSDECCADEAQESCTSGCAA
jgi:ArsR family transcriptional regulator, arsenate/arsenite/antimonite-responsive transcriptional repressor